MRPTTPPVVRLQRPASLESANLTTIQLDDVDDSSPLLIENGATSETDHTTWQGADEVQGTDGAASTEPSRPCLQGWTRIAVFVLAAVAIVGLAITAGLTMNWRKYGIQLYLVRSAADDYTTQATPLLGTGRLQNMMYGYCVSLNVPEPPGKPPAEDYLRSVLCDKAEYRSIQLYFRYNFDRERLETVDGDCIVPMEPERPGSRMRLEPCSDVENEPGAQWQLTGMANRQLRNGRGMCLDLEHQHRHGPLIQWTCKVRYNYKPVNQMFTWIPASVKSVGPFLNDRKQNQQQQH